MYYKNFLTKENDFYFNTWVANDISTDYRIFFEENFLQIITEDKDLFNGLNIRLQLSINYEFWWTDYEAPFRDYTKCFRSKNNRDRFITVTLTK